MPESYTCWKCGGPLQELLLPLPRHEECPHCRAQQHVCRMCVYFDTTAPQQCREPVAENVSASAYGSVHVVRRAPGERALCPDRPVEEQSVAVSAADPLNVNALGLEVGVRFHSAQMFPQSLKKRVGVVRVT